MLQSLRIRNYAIIEDQEIQFSGGLNIITGETGAGKSILLGALDLLLGARADSTALTDKNVKCVVEGVFRPNRTGLSTFLEDNDLDVEEELTIRREVKGNGKSRAFVNDTPVLLTLLKELSRLIIDVHQQFAVLEIQEHSYQIQALDAFASITRQVSQYRQRYLDYTLLKKHYAELKVEELNARKEQDYLEFQLKEFEAIDMSSDEVEELEQRFKRLSHAQDIRDALQKAFHRLDSSDNAVLDQLRDILHELTPFDRYDTELAGQTLRLEQAIIELDDIAMQLQSTGSSLDYGEESLEDMESKLNMIRRLQLKHGVQTARELFGIRDSLREQLDSYASLDQELVRLEKQTSEEESALFAMADTLSELRTEHIKPLESSITALLHDLKMEHAALSIELEQTDELNNSGRDKVRYLFAPNEGSAFLSIRKIASGGELSRLSLCIKAVVAQKMEMPVLVFDEIDQGMSGEVAKRMGEILGDLAKYHQVIMITHSPQIASRAQAHLHVVKKTKNKKTFAQISLLPQEDRIVEIAKMLSGDPPTEAAVLNARELIQN